MKRQRHTPEQVIRKLREAERLLGEGKTIPEAAAELGISENAFHRWRNQYGGMKADDAKRLKELEVRALKEFFGETGEPSPSARGGRDAWRPSRRQRALGMPRVRAAPLHAASRAQDGRGRCGVACRVAELLGAAAAVGVPSRASSAA
jgi:putative transposase